MVGKITIVNINEPKKESIDDEDDWCGCYVCKPEKNSYILSKSENDSYYSDSYYYDSDDYDW